MNVEISAQVVKKLRDKTGAGMMNCKQALLENSGNFDKAIESLRLKGMATADKKASRSTNEGMIYSYIHTGNKLGILVEVSCETDFVAKRPEFIDLTKNIAMQLASNSDIEFVNSSDISETVRDKIWNFESAKDDLSNKSEEIQRKIIQGRVEKSLNTKVLLKQNYIRNSNITVEEFIKQTIGLLGENIKVTRFVRYVFGELDEE